MPVPALHRLTAALRRLPAGAAEGELLGACARLAATELGCPWAVIWVPAEPAGAWQAAAWWPEAASPPAAAPAEPAFPLAPAPEQPPLALLQVGHAPDAELLVAFAASAGYCLAEARTRVQACQRVEELTRRARAAEEALQNLTLRIEEMRSELGSTQRQQLVLGERNRIAQDLHDRAAQTLFLINLKVDWLLARVPADSPLRAELERLKDLAVQGAAQTREAIYALRAPELTDGGLPGGLRRLLRSAEEAGLAANLTVCGYPAPLPAAVEDALFKVAQEALTNACKHSGGSAVMVSLRFSPEAVTLVVQDDGAGLPAGNARGAQEDGRPRLGLTGMRERVASLGGSLELESGDDGGLLVRASIPLREGAYADVDPSRHRG